MRTAIILLSILALASIIGTLLPQIDQNPRGVMGFVQRHPSLAVPFARLGLFNIFSSGWFLGVAALMYLALTACLYRRVPAAVRRWRVPRARTPYLWGETASIVFHLSFFILLAGIVYGKATGFVGTVAVVEGDRFVEAPASYDSLQEGIWLGRHQGFEVQVDSFQARYHPSGLPADFVSHVRVFDRGREQMVKDVRVNQYLGYQGVKLYQQSYGWAPAITVTAPDGRVVAEGAVIFGGSPEVATGVVKAPAAGAPPEQVGLQAFLYPDPVLDGVRLRPVSPNPRNPLLVLHLFKGDLHLDRPQRVFDLDTSALSLQWRGALSPGETIQTPDGYRLTFADLKPYTVFGVKRDPGVPIVYGAFALGISALLLSLYLPLLARRNGALRSLGGRRLGDG
jgi:cytochrome c biogenesis protein